MSLDFMEPNWGVVGSVGLWGLTKCRCTHPGCLLTSDPGPKVPPDLMTSNPQVPTDFSLPGSQPPLHSAEGSGPFAIGSELCRKCCVPEWVALPFPCFGRLGQTWSPEFSPLFQALHRAVSFFLGSHGGAGRGRSGSTSGGSFLGVAFGQAWFKATLQEDLGDFS